MEADRDVSLHGAQLNMTGDTTLSAGRNLDVHAVITTTEQHLTWDARNHLNQSQDTVNGSTVNAGENLTLKAGQNVDAQAATLTSDHGIAIQGGGDVTLGTAKEASHFDEAHYQKSKGIFSSPSSEARDAWNAATQVGTTVSGDTVSFTIGKREQTDRLAQEGATQSASRSLVGSTEGSLTLAAGTEARVSGSDLVAAKDLSITAPSITIDPGLDRTRTQESHDFKQSGLTVAVSSPVLAAAQTLRAMNTAAGPPRTPA